MAIIVDTEGQILAHVLHQDLAAEGSGSVLIIMESDLDPGGPKLTDPTDLENCEIHG
jgi:hypothetical protein